LRVPIAIPEVYEQTLWILQNFLLTNPDLHHGLLGYFEALEISQVVVEGVAYTVQTDQVARPWRVPSPSQLTLKLLKPLTIER
jgi:hypothetical protein